jgi:hypothetical protein
LARSTAGASYEAGERPPSIHAVPARLTAGICEDDHQLRGVVRDALSREGFEVRTTASGTEAQRAADAEHAGLRGDPRRGVRDLVRVRAHALDPHDGHDAVGASIGDEMSQNSHKYGGLGLGTTGASHIFLACILGLVTYLTITRRDRTDVVAAYSG